MKTLIINIVDKAGSLSGALNYLKAKSIDLRFLAAWRIGDDFGFAHLVPKESQDIKELGEDTDPRLGVVDPVPVDVLAVRIRDRVGGLQEVLEPLAARGVSIAFCFSYALDNGFAIVIIGLESAPIALAKKVLAESGVIAAEDVDIYR